MANEDIRKGGLTVNPDGTVNPQPDFYAIKRENQPLSPTFPTIKLQVLEATALAFEKGNTSGKIEEIAGKRISKKTINPDYKPMPDILPTEPLTEEMKKWKKMSDQEKVEALEKRINKALIQYPALAKKRIEGLVEEVLQGVVSDESDDGIVIEEELRQLMADYINNNLMLKTL